MYSYEQKRRTNNQTLGDAAHSLTRRNQVVIIGKEGVMPLIQRNLSDKPTCTVYIESSL